MKKHEGSEDIIWFEQLRKDDVPIVGGKNANLGEMLSFGIPVPEGFAVTAKAYQKFITKTGIANKIYEIIKEVVKDPNDPKQFEEASIRIRELIESTPMPKDIEKAIRDSYRKLSERVSIPQVSVAVRSSATAEDLPDASFAGQQETFLNIKGEDEVIKSVHKCWSSLFTPRAIFYRTSKGFQHEKVLISVGVQRMVNAKAAGVMFTLHPATGDTSKIIIESTWGLGESLVSGATTPDRFIVDKNSLEIVEKEVARKTIMYVRDPKTGKTIHSEVPIEKQNTPSLTDEEVKYLAQLGKRIEEHYGRAQDIEFAIDSDLTFPKNIFIVQSRPETVWSLKTPKKVEEVKLVSERKPIIKGLPASPGIHAGVARVIKTIEEAKIMKENDILVTKMTNPDWVPYMKIAGSIVTDEGGMTCHAAIVSRELGIPCIVGTKEATKTMVSGKEYTVDAKSGIVYEGIVEEMIKPAIPTTVPTVSTLALAHQMPIVATKIYVNLSIPEVAEKVFKESQPDGVGLLRAEHLMLSVGKHPRLLIEEGGTEKMINSFAEGIRKVAEVFYPRPIVYRFLDFKPDEFLALPGGEKYEKEAGHVGPNPLIGYRGCFRYIKEPDVFRLECRAIRKVREEFGLNNVWVMLPFVRTIEEFRNAKKIMEEEKLIRGPDFKLWIMVEVPSTVLLIDKFIDEGIDGVSFGTNDLTMLILGIDRDDASIQEIYDERNLAVLRAMSHVIRICKSRGVTTSICGQAPSNYPEVVEFLVREGATSLSVNPDKVNETRQLVASIEQKIILEELRALKEGRTKEFFKPSWSKELE
ncbi:MAG: phosphoenolpyruvate synthase [Candidatus Bathyarchaeia archaeon]